MRLCCPINRGCNARDERELCVLGVLHDASPANREARIAIERWQAYAGTSRQSAGSRQRRFARRAYERARGRALTAVAARPATERVGV